MPFGVLVPIAFAELNVRTASLTVGLGFAVSLCIELAQLLIPGRVPDPRDLVSNTLGVAIGLTSVSYTHLDVYKRQT